MPYIPPENVIAPADYWQHQVPPMIPYNDGPGDFSVAEGTWNGEPCLAILWNGDDQGGTGFPTVGPPGHPAWFVVPRELEAMIRITLAAMKILKG